MKRFAGLVVLMALTTPAYAGSYSFVIGGHHIHVEASRNCRSLSCVSWSETSKKRDRDDTVATAAAAAPAQTPAAPVTPATVVPAPAPVAAPPAPTAAPAPAPVAIQPAPSVPQPQVVVVPVQTPPVQTPPAVAPAPVQPPGAAAAPPVLKPVDTRAIAVTPPVPPPVPPTAALAAKPDVKVEAKVEPKVDAKVEPKPDPKVEPKPSVGFDLRPDAKLESKVETKAEAKVEPKPETTSSVTKTPAETPQADKPAVATKPTPSKTTLQSEGDSIGAPLGDWQTEGRKGLVRIEPCGTALCGYIINTATNTKGETVLINMKPKADSEWSGSIYSRASGNTYYATMSVKRPNTLRVEACVVGRYFCSGNNWTRITTKSDEVITTREASAEPR
jgi:uncharacterized protein (DUF2147 family)